MPTPATCAWPRGARVRRGEDLEDADRGLGDSRSRGRSSRSPSGSPPSSSVRASYSFSASRSGTSRADTPSQSPDVVTTPHPRVRTLQGRGAPGTFTGVAPPATARLAQSNSPSARWARPRCSSPSITSICWRRCRASLASASVGDPNAMGRHSSSRRYPESLRAEGPSGLVTSREVTLWWVWSGRLPIDV
jgi:hypothetical protein